MPEKRCSKCGLIKLLSAYHKNKSQKDGLYSQCKDCRNSYLRLYYKDHSEKESARKKLTRQTQRTLKILEKTPTGILKRCGGCNKMLDTSCFNKNQHKSSVNGLQGNCQVCQKLRREGLLKAKEKPSKIPKGVTKTCRDCGLEKDHTDFGNDKKTGDGLTCYCLSCRVLHAKGLRFSPKENNNFGDSKRCRECRKIKTLFDFYEGHTRCKICVKSYRKNLSLTEKGRISLRVRSQERRARKFRAEGVCSETHLQKLHSLQNGLCVYCLKSLTESYHVDHVLALARGGTNWPTNLALTCPDCNLRKNSMTVERFCRRSGFDCATLTERLTWLHSHFPEIPT